MSLEMKNAENINGYAPSPFNIWRKLGFGHAYVPPSEEEDEDTEKFVAASLVIETYVFLDWKDRLRVLLSGKLHIFSRTRTDVVIHTAQTRSDTRVLAPNDTP